MCMYLKHIFAHANDRSESDLRGKFDFKINTNLYYNNIFHNFIPIGR